MFKDDYKSIMDEVKITPNMKSRLMSNLTNEKVINKKEKINFLKYAYRLSPVMICLLVVTILFSNGLFNKKDLTVVNPTIVATNGKSSNLTIEIEGIEVVFSVDVNDEPVKQGVTTTAANDTSVKLVANYMDEVQMEISKDGLWYLYTSEKPLNQQQWNIVLSYIESLD